MFLDKDELKVTNNLNADIKEKLKNSDFLIVVCSPKAKNAPWIIKEINYFKDTHENSDQNIITVLADGKPEDAVPDIINTKDENGEINRLSANFKEECDWNKELPRIISTMIGCEYNELVNRYKAETERRNKIIISIIAVVSIAFTALLMTIRNSKNNTQLEISKNLAIESERQYDNYNRERAVETALDAFHLEKNKNFNIPEAKRALLKATEVYRQKESELEVINNISIPVQIKEYAIYEKGDGKYISILGKDARVYVYNIKSGEKVFDLKSIWTKPSQPEDVHIAMPEENQLLFWNKNFAKSIL